MNADERLRQVTRKLEQYEQFLVQADERLRQMERKLDLAEFPPYPFVPCTHFNVTETRTIDRPIRSKCNDCGEVLR